MIITDEYTSENDYNNIKLDEKGDFIENIRLIHDRKYGVNYCRRVKAKCVVKFLNKLKNETKNVAIERYNVVGGVKKILQSSKDMYKFITPIELKFIIEGKILKTI